MSYFIGFIALTVMALVSSSLKNMLIRTVILAVISVTVTLILRALFF